MSAPPFTQPRTDENALQTNQRQIRGLQRNTIECFAKLTFKVEARPPVMADTFTCYEERPECLSEFGWCRVRGGVGAAPYGFCNEVNYLPDTPSYRCPDHIQGVANVLAGIVCMPLGILIV